MKKLILALTVSSFAVGAAYAQASFETIDADADGSVTLAEANNAGLPWTEDQFKLADRDGNGALNADEFAAAVQ
ncbi:MAG: EF-hand domain-containing protein [Pseudomonadota bacterium]